MVPLNTSVTQTGNYVLSDLDVAKINCAYQCEAQGGPAGAPRTPLAAQVLC